jgi:hypothetical protein
MKTIVKFLDKIFLINFKGAPVWFVSILVGVVLNGSTNKGMNGDFWSGNAPLGDASLITFIGSLFLILGTIGGAWWVGKWIRSRFNK